VAKLINQVIARAEKLQGTTARLTARLPAFSQRALAKVLGFDNQHPTLDSHLQMLLAVRNLINNADLIGHNPEKSRRHFRKEMASIIGTPTPVGNTKDFTIPSRSGELKVRHYIPAGKILLHYRSWYFFTAVVLSSVILIPMMNLVVCSVRKRMSMS